MFRNRRFFKKYKYRINYLTIKNPYSKIFKYLPQKISYSKLIKQFIFYYKIVSYIKRRNLRPRRYNLYIRGHYSIIFKLPRRQNKYFIRIYSQGRFSGRSFMREKSMYLSFHKKYNFYKIRKNRISGSKNRMIKSIKFYKKFRRCFKIFQSHIVKYIKNKKKIRYYFQTNNNLRKEKLYNRGNVRSLYDFCRKYGKFDWNNLEIIFEKLVYIYSFLFKGNFVNAIQFISNYAERLSKPFAKSLIKIKAFRFPMMKPVMSSSRLGILMPSIARGISKNIKLNPGIDNSIFSNLFKEIFSKVFKFSKSQSYIGLELVAFSREHFNSFNEQKKEYKRMRDERNQLWLYGDINIVKKFNDKEHQERKKGREKYGRSYDKLLNEIRFSKLKANTGKEFRKRQQWINYLAIQR